MSCNRQWLQNFDHQRTVIVACMLINSVPRDSAPAWRPVSTAAANLQVFPHLHIEGRGSRASPVARSL